MSQKTQSLLLLLAAAACTLRPLDPGASTIATATDPTSTSSASPEYSSTSPPPTPTTTATTNGSTSTSTTGTTDPGGTFLVPPDGGGCAGECDQWTEDCPEGQKCMPYSGDGDSSWESLKCSDIVPDPDAPGEPCTVVGSAVSGEDTCEKHAMCWYVDPNTGIGTCIAMCTGSPDALGCDDPSTSCSIQNDGVLTLCFPQCDPIAQDCPAGELCVPTGSWNDFTCTVDASGDEGQLFDPCEYVNACDPGLACTNPALASECDPTQLGCCLPFCDLDDPNTCPGQGQQCLPWHEDPEDAATFNQDVGLCQLP